MPASVPLSCSHSLPFSTFPIKYDSNTFLLMLQSRFDPNIQLSMAQGSAQMTGATVARQNLQLQIHTASIVTQAETLLKLLSEMRYNLVFSHPEAISREVNDTISQCRQLGAETQNTISSIRTSVETCVDLIEEALQTPNAFAK